MNGSRATAPSIRAWKAQNSRSAWWGVNSSVTRVRQIVPSTEVSVISMVPGSSFTRRTCRSLKGTGISNLQSRQGVGTMQRRLVLLPVVGDDRGAPPQGHRGAVAVVLGRLHRGVGRESVDVAVRVVLRVVTPNHPASQAVPFPLLRLAFQPPDIGQRPHGLVPEAGR